MSAMFLIGSDPIILMRSDIVDMYKTQGVPFLSLNRFTTRVAKSDLESKDVLFIDEAYVTKDHDVRDKVASKRIDVVYLYNKREKRFSRMEGLSSKDAGELVSAVQGPLEDLPLLLANSVVKGIAKKRLERGY